MSLKASNLTKVAKRRKLADPYAVVSLSLSFKLDSDNMILGKTEV